MPNSQYRQTSSTDKLLFWMVLLPICMDYKPAGQQAWSTIVYSVIVILSVIGTLILIARNGLSKQSSLKWVAAAFALLFVDAITVAVVRGREIDDILRHAPPLILLITGTLTASALASGRHDPRELWPLAIAACFIGMIVNVILVSTLQNLAFDNIRYQVLSGSTALISASTVAVIFFGGARYWQIVMIAMNAAVIMLSVTRTQLVMFGGMFVAMLAGARERALHPRFLPIQIAGTLVAVVGVLSLGSLLPGNQVERWATRLLLTEEQKGKVDITEVTRRGETNYQIQQLKSDAVGALFGFGLAPNNRYDDVSARVIENVLGGKSARATEDGIGHNNYAGTLYIAGLIAGGPVLIIQFIAWLRSFSALRWLSDPRRLNFSRSLISAPLGITAYMVFGLLGGTFGSRSACLCLALSIGFTLWILESEKNADRI